MKSYCFRTVLISSGVGVMALPWVPFFSSLSAVIYLFYLYLSIYLLIYRYLFIFIFSCIYLCVFILFFSATVGVGTVAITCFISVPVHRCLSTRGSALPQILLLVHQWNLGQCVSRECCLLGGVWPLTGRWSRPGYQAIPKRRPLGQWCVWSSVAEFGKQEVRHYILNPKTKIY